jgi:hypothetical protein
MRLVELLHAEPPPRGLPLAALPQPRYWLQAVVVRRRRYHGCHSLTVCLKREPGWLESERHTIHRHATAGKLEAVRLTSHPRDSGACQSRQRKPVQARDGPRDAQRGTVQRICNE